MNRSEIKATLAILSAEWPNEIITEERVTAWVWALEPWPYDAVEAAVKLWLRAGGKFFPHPSELIAIVAEQAVAPGVVPETAWAEVLRLASEVGANGMPTFSHSLIAEAAAAIGWRELCLADVTVYPTLRAQFREALRAAKAAAIHRVAADPVAARPALDRPMSTALAEA